MMPKKTRRGKKKMSQGSKTGVAQMERAVSMDNLTSYLKDYDVQGWQLKGGGGG